jgi:cell wall-associated NlpC family hydrolase
MRAKKYILIFWLALSCGFAHADEDVGEQGPSMTQITTQWTNTAQEILLNALSLTGVKYKYGGKSPETGLDCSGFVRYVFQQAANLTLPHGARAISQLGQAIPMEQLQPGDLVFFNTLKNAFSHVGIYIGEGRFIHAPSSGGRVHVANMNDAYWSSHFNGARRLPVSAQQPAEVSAE